MDFDPDYNPRFKTKISTKFVATVASIWIQSTSGSLYTFAIYSSVLKSSQDYDQSTLDTVSVFKDFGANVGVLSGLLYSAACGGGPWVVLLVGALLCFAGYFLMWLTVVGWLPRPHVLLMCLYMLLAAQATTFFNTANVVTAVHNFPRHRGTVVGIMKV
nr:protein NUCLEAR FUSION DEFECTIVE 4-like [Ipomoea trifida]